MIRDWPKSFRNIIVHPSQEVLRRPAGVFFRGGPDWPRFELQIYARHCRWSLPVPVDSRPHRTEQPPEAADTGFWCGPICLHFGHMIADFGMRIAASSRLDPAAPLVFSTWANVRSGPPPFFWEIIDNFGIDRRRVMLIRKPTRFARLTVLPQAERLFGGGPSRGHLRLMDAITAASSPPERDIACLFVSRGRWRKGRFAGEGYLDEALAAAGVTVLHPESVDLGSQLRLYRRARRLIFSEGSALHALQLLGHVDAAVLVLNRRPRSRTAATSLRPRVPQLRYARAARGLVHGLIASGGPDPTAGMSVLDEDRCMAALRDFGIDLASIWQRRAYAERRDGDLAAWVEQRLAAAAHPDERHTIERRLHALSLGHVMP